jgi:hypothetical protein
MAGSPKVDGHNQRTAAADLEVSRAVVRRRKGDNLEGAATRTITVIGSTRKPESTVKPKSSRRAANRSGTTAAPFGLLPLIHLV